MRAFYLLALAATLAQASIQEHFTAPKDLDSWSTDKLQDYLSDYGLTSPATTHKQLLQLAKAKNDQLAKAAASVQDAVTSAASSAASEASSATYALSHKLNDATDYIFSVWEDSDLAEWLETHGIKDKPASRNGLLAAVREDYVTTVDHIYDGWTDSTIGKWLADHGVTPKDPKRKDLLEQMQDHFYTAEDKVYSAWDDAKIRAWLAENDAQ